MKYILVRPVCCFARPTAALPLLARCRTRALPELGRVGRLRPHSPRWAALPRACAPPRWPLPLPRPRPRRGLACRARSARCHCCRRCHARVPARSRLPRRARVCRCWAAPARRALLGLRRVRAAALGLRRVCAVALGRARLLGCVGPCGPRVRFRFLISSEFATAYSIQFQAKLR